MDSSRTSGKSQLFFECRRGFVFTMQLNAQQSARALSRKDWQAMNPGKPTSVQTWIYRPYLLNGALVDIQTVITLAFQAP
jgi:hypothetical protein